jgi:hypothetical protein
LRVEDGTDSGSNPMAGFGVSGVEPPSSVTVLLVIHSTRIRRVPIFYCFEWQKIKIILFEIYVSVHK